MKTSDLIIYVSLIGAIYWVGRIYNFWSAGLIVKKVKNSLARDVKELKKQKRVLRVLNLFGTMDEKFGNLGTFEVKDINYRILRLNLYIKPISRLLNPNELNGLFILINLVGSGILVFGLCTLNVLFAVMGALLLFNKKVFNIYADLVISDGDEELTLAFPDFYLFMYSRLKLGVNTRLLPTLNEYAKSLEDIYGDGVGNHSIYQFVNNFKQYINVYSDEVIALKKLRDMYRCSVVLNFINIAIQSLQGVDNIDKLQSFKTELKMKSMDNMEKQLEKAKEKAMRLVYVVFFIMFQFIVATWISKIDISLFSNIF